MVEFALRNSRFPFVSVPRSLGERRSQTGGGGNVDAGRRSIAGERKARVRNVVVCTRHCRPYPPWLHGLHTRATVAAVPRSRLSSCALYRYTYVRVCVYVRTCVYTYVRAPVAHPRAHVGVLVFVCVQRERQREKERIEGNWKDEGRQIEREETGKRREKEREREFMARRVDGKIIRAVDGRKLEGQREGSEVNRWRDGERGRRRGLR